MAANEKHTLDLSGAGIKKIEKRDGVGFKQLILDNNELTKLENLECFPDVEKVTASGNAIVRMYGVSKCHHLTHINLPNNNIICIEGLKDLPNLTYLNLSVNNIKVIQNLQYSNNLVHLDLSRNNISAISDISNLSKLKVLHLNGNKISTLNRASTYFPTCICTLSLSDNCITDLNEVSHLVKLHCLEQLTISGNPCLSIEELSLPPFDYRPFIINWCLGLRLLDGHVATQKESLKAEWLYSQGKGRHYKPGEHMELIEYLCQVCPITADQSTDEEDEKLIRILHKQRQHKEQFLNEMAQVPQSEISETPTGSSISMTQSYHFKTETSPKNQETEMSASSNIVPSKIMYESAPEVLFHSTTSETIQSVPPSFQSGKYPRSVSKSEILHSSIKSPIMIEQVEVESSTKPKIQEPTKSPYQYYEDRRVRPSSSSEIRPTHTPKGTLIRKVSKRATSPCTSAPPGGRSKLPHSTSRNRISPSRSCILTARLSAAAKNSSESDTSEEVSHTNRTPQRSFRSLSTDTQSGSNSPVLQQHVYSSLSPTKRAFGVDSGPQTQITSSPKFGHGSSPHIAKSKTMSEIYGKSEEDIVRAATKIQSVWRGYFVRHHNHRVFKLLQEIRFRRLEDHIQHLHGHLCRLTDFVLRQQQDLQHERELRKMQAEDIRHLHEKAKDLQKSVSVVLAKAKSNVFQNLSEQDTSNRDLSRDNSMLPDAKFDKHLPSQSSDSLNLALKFSTQMYQENSSIYSPSSQTSSVTSSVPDTSFSRSKSRRELQPSVSDISDADSGMQSMVSPNIAAGECERHHSSHEMDHSAMNGYADSCAYPSYKGDLSDYTRKYSGKFHSEKESHYEENAALHTKISKHPKSLSSVRHALPVSAIPSLDEDTCYTQSSHMPNAHFSKNFMSLNKTNYVEYPNSSIENSPCSVNSEPYVFCKQHLYSNAMPNPSCQSKSEECNKWKNSCISNGFTDVDSAPKCYSKSCMANQMKDKYNVHHAHCARSCSQNTCKHSEKGDKLSESVDSNCTAKSCAVLPKRLNQLTQNKVTSPLEEKDSPSSPCTVEMSGCISHSCSFQSDGFTAEELSATATVKLFSTRAVSMTCTNGTMSPQTNPQRPLTLSDASPQANLRSPLVLAASVWEKKVQDIESTFHQLQTQIRDLEGAFGQIGQFGQFFYPSLLQEESKEARPAIHCAEQAPGALVLDMPKINFKRSDNANDRLFQTCFAGSVPYLPPSSQQQAMNQSNDCRVEEIDQDVHSIVEERDDLPNPTSDNTETKS